MRYLGETKSFRGYGNYYSNIQYYLLQSINQLGHSFWQEQVTMIISLYAVEQKNDKPLMDLPKEIRELVLPMLTTVLKD